MAKKENKRPASAEQVRDWLKKKAAQYHARSSPASEAQRSLVASKLNEAYQDNTSVARRDFIRYIFGFDSTKLLTEGQAAAILDWLVAPQDSTGDYPLAPYARAEAEAVRWQVKLDAVELKYQGKSMEESTMEEKQVAAELVQRSWTEAPASLNFFFGYKGYRPQLTLRGETGGEVLVKLEQAITFLEEHGAASANDGYKRQLPPQPPDDAPESEAPRPVRPAAAPVPAPGGQADDANAVVKSGTAKLEKLIVQPDGKIEFYLEGFKWPLKDARGAEVVARLFADELEELGWNAQTLGKPAIFTQADFGHLVVTWQKPGKYYNVVAVKV